MTELRELIDELFDALADGDLDQMLEVLERLDAWRERDRRRPLRRLGLAR